MGRRLLLPHEEGEVCTRLPLGGLIRAARLVLLGDRYINLMTAIFLPHTCVRRVKNCLGGAVKLAFPPPRDPKWPREKGFFITPKPFSPQQNSLAARSLAASSSINFSACPPSDAMQPGEQKSEDENDFFSLSQLLLKQTSPLDR